MTGQTAQHSLTDQQTEWLTSFQPRRGLSNGHLQTIVGNFLPRPPFRLVSVAEMVVVDPADGSRVLCHCHWYPEPNLSSRLTLVLVHQSGRPTRAIFRE